VDAPINIKDVAAHAGVSVRPSLMCPNRPEIVAQATPERVRTAIKALGSVRNESAGQLRADRSRMTGTDFPYLRRDIALRCREDIEASPELTDSERTAVLGATAMTLIPRLATLRS
jgi:DNA-binding LacI/PurR family transcriptional regulator